MHIRILFAAVLLAAGLVGCEGRVAIERNNIGGVDITVSLTETEVNDILRDVVENRDDPLLRDLSVDLRPGVIQLNGTYDRRDGTGSDDGSITMSVGVTNNRLTLNISDVDIAGYDLGDDRIQQINRDIEEGLAQAAQNSDNQSQLTAVSITDTNLSFTIRTQGED